MQSMTWIKDGLRVDAEMRSVRDWTDKAKKKRTFFKRTNEEIRLGLSAKDAMKFREKSEQKEQME